MKLTRHVIAAVPIVLLFLGLGQQVQAYWGDGFRHSWLGDEGWNGSGWNGLGAYGNGYYAGERDAIYDHDNNLAYNPRGQCLPCHSEDYWNNFHQGYDQYWNSHQSQESNQGSSINIYGNNNYVNTVQYSSQQQNPLQQLAHTVCGWVNCNQPQGGP